MQTSSIALINQGTYGCILKPGMNCKGEIEEKGFITKIQSDKQTIDNEVAIGEHLLENNTSMKEFNSRFAPILDSCPISIGTIKEETIEKCDIMKDNVTTTFYSNKIRYVGKYNITDYFLKIIRSSSKSVFLYSFFESHRYLLDSFEMLREKRVVHFDLYNKNIMMDDHLFVPIIIDFGLSIQIDKLQTPEDYKLGFFMYYDKYPPWCLEIILISFIIHGFSVDSFLGGFGKKKEKKEKMEKKEKKEKMEKSNDFTIQTIFNIKDWTKRIVNLSDLYRIIDHYFQENYIMKRIQSNNLKKAYRKKWKRWVRNLVQKDASGKKVVEQLMHYWQTWDTFAVSVIYFSMSQAFIPKHFLNYHEMLVKNMVALPSVRETPIKMQEKLSAFLADSANISQEYYQWNSPIYSSDFSSDFSSHI